MRHFYFKIYLFNFIVISLINRIEGIMPNTIFPEIDEKEAQIKDQIDKTKDLKNAVALNESCNKQLEGMQLVWHTVVNKIWEKYQEVLSKVVIRKSPLSTMSRLLMVYPIAIVATGDRQWIPLLPLATMGIFIGCMLLETTIQIRRRYCRYCRHYDHCRHTSLSPLSIAF